jgi:hypothetical protein
VATAIAVDGSGVKVTNRGEWIRRKWKVKHGYVKIHIRVGVKRKKILALKVTGEKVGDGWKKTITADCLDSLKSVVTARMMSTVGSDYVDYHSG